MDLNLHVFCHDFVIQFQAGNEVLNVVHLHFVVGLAEQELGCGVAVADDAVGLDGENAVAELVEQAKSR